MHFVVPAATFLLALLTVNAKSDDALSIPCLGPCSSAFCAHGPCVDTMCKDPTQCGDRIQISCRVNCGEEPKTCGEGQFLVYDGAGCKVCKDIEKDVVDPCASEGACNKGEECRRNDVQCALAPCPPIKECRKSCPPVHCDPGNCFRYEARDGCLACKCCK